MIVHTKDWEADDMSEVSARLKSVSPGAVSQEFSLRRNQLGQLGFHVQHDGLITGERGEIQGVKKVCLEPFNKAKSFGTPCSIFDGTKDIKFSQSQYKRPDNWK